MASPRVGSSEELYYFPTLHCAARGGCVKIIKQVLRRGLDPDQVDYEGFTPLHWAVRQGHLGASRLLLQYATNVNLVNKYLQSTVLSAAGASLVELIEVLVQHAVDYNHGHEL